MRGVSGLAVLGCWLFWGCWACSEGGGRAVRGELVLSEHMRGPLVGLRGAELLLHVVVRIKAGVGSDGWLLRPRAYGAGH
eukprot:6843496-Heterocapsa_arctica.AAC.1